MWGGKANAGKEINMMRGKRFRNGKYAMFIHWGLFSKLGNEWKGKTYYGIGEWLINKSMANIPIRNTYLLPGILIL